MNKKIYNYMYAKRCFSIHDISKSLHIGEFEVLKIINNFIIYGIVKLETPIPLGINNDNSCYYSLTGKRYIDN